MKNKESGLGISLEGTVRVVAGKEVQARHYIRAIAPNGPIAKLGLYRVGDELLEVSIESFDSFFSFPMYPLYIGEYRVYDISLYFRDITRRVA